MFKNKTKIKLKEIIGEYRAKRRIKKDSKNRFKGINLTKPRKVATYELEFFFENGGASVINDNEYTIQKNHILFAKPGDIRYSHLPFKCFFIHFTVTDKTIINALDNISEFFRISDANTTEQLFKNIIKNFYSADAFDNISACAELVSIFNYFCKTKIEKDNIISIAKAFIQQNYNRDITINDIADACNVCTSYLHKTFKNALGVTPGIFLLNHRISVAQSLLVNSNMPLTEIAISCGFNSQSYFSDCFKKNIGITPKDFRKNSTYTL